MVQGDAVTILKSFSIFIGSIEKASCMSEEFRVKVVLRFDLQL